MARVAGDFSFVYSAAVFQQPSRAPAPVGYHRVLPQASECFQLCRRTRMISLRLGFLRIHYIMPRQHTMLG